MNKERRSEIKSIHIFTGFFAGLFLSLLVLILALQLEVQEFTFNNLLSIHAKYRIIYLFDSLSIIGAFLGFIIARGKIKSLIRFEQHELLEIDINNFIKSAIQDLTLGNLNAKYNNDDIDSELMDRLKSLQSRLKENRELEKSARLEDQRRNWTSQGLAEFGDLLRTHSSDRDKLGYAIISQLVRYLEINQGGFFVVERESNSRTLNMIACHAYDRDKFPDKTLQWGEGLIGAVAIEQKSYYTNKIPDTYLSITSGLGRANPRYLLIVPLVLNSEVFGVFELASFNPIENFQKQFIERVAENTAMTLSIMDSNYRTEQLLRETQEQASKLALQEEKVRQNIEELKMTQAEAARQSEQFISFTNTVNHTLVRAEYNTEGILNYANTRFLKKLGYSGNREVEGKHISMFIHANDRQWFNEIWNKLSGGGAHFEGYMRHITKLGQDLWTMATYTCVRKDDGSVDKILFLAIDSTRQKEESLDFEGQIKAINKLSPKVEFSPDGRLLNFNELFENTIKYSSKELKNKNIFDFITRTDQERFNEIWDQVISGTPFQGQMRMQGKFEEEIWLRASFSSITDVYGEVDKIVFLAYEITKEKQLEFTMRNQNERLKIKEEEMKLQSLDLKTQIEDLKKGWITEKEKIVRDNKKYLDIMDQYPQAVCSMNNQGFIIFFNKAAEKYWKIRKSEVLNNPVTNLLSESQESPELQSLVQPGKPVLPTAFKKVKIIIPGLPAREEFISVIKTESGPELIYTLILHLNK